MERADEDAFHQRLIERYDELTAAYQDATRSGPSGFPDFKRLFGLDRDRYFAPPSISDIPKEQMSMLLLMDDIFSGAQSAQRIKSRISYRNDDWSLSASEFADGDRVIMPGNSLPIHRRGNIERPIRSNNLLVWQYSNGTKLYLAILSDTDYKPSYTSDYAPAEYRRVMEIEEELGTRLLLRDVNPEMIRQRDQLKRELERLTNSEVVKRFLKERDEATKPDMVPNYVVFDHPYEILIQPATPSGLTESDFNDPSKFYYRFGGEGIFQKDVYEFIEIPSSSPLGVHARKWNTDPYRKEYRIKDLPGVDAELLKAYFAKVFATLRRADEILATV